MIFLKINSFSEWADSLPINCTAPNYVQKSRYHLSNWPILPLARHSLKSATPLHTTNPTPQSSPSTTIMRKII